MKQRDRLMLLGVLAAIVLVAGWFLALAPRREEAAKLGEQVADAARRRATRRSPTSSPASLPSASSRATTRPSRDSARPCPTTTTCLRCCCRSSAPRRRRRSTSARSKSARAQAPRRPLRLRPSTRRRPRRRPRPRRCPPARLSALAGFPTMPFSFDFDGDFFHLSDFVGRLERFLVVQQPRAGGQRPLHDHRRHLAAGRRGRLPAHQARASRRRRTCCRRAKASPTERPRAVPPTAPTPRPPPAAPPRPAPRPLPRRPHELSAHHLVGSRREAAVAGGRAAARRPRRRAVRAREIACGTSGEPCDDARRHGGRRHAPLRVGRERRRRAVRQRAVARQSQEPLQAAARPAEVPHGRRRRHAARRDRAAGRLRHVRDRRGQRRRSRDADGAAEDLPRGDGRRALRQGLPVPVRCTRTCRACGRCRAPRVRSRSSWACARASTPRSS